MQTMYLIVITILGGCVALFAAAGWSSYKDKKLPATPVLFRWFISGLLTTGLGAYAWLFGAGGDPAALLEKFSDALEVKEVMEGLSSAVGGAAEGAAKAAAGAVEELTVGMPTF